MSYQDDSLLYLKEVLEDWITAESKTGSVIEGVPEKGLPTGISDLDLFITNLSGYPQYNENTLLITGHIIAARFKETGVADAADDTSDVLDSLMRYIYTNISNLSPVLGGKSSLWLDVEITNEGYGDPETAYENAIVIETIFTNGVSNPHW